MFPSVSGTKVASLQNFARQRTKGPKLCGAKVEGSITPQGKFAETKF